MHYAAIVQNKSGHIDNQIPGIMFRLSIKPKTWFDNALNFEALYYKRFAPRFLLTGRLKYSRSTIFVYVFFVDWQVYSTAMY